MEVYVEYSDYQTFYPTSTLTKEEFDALNIPAQSVIDEMTMYRIPPLSDWGADSQERIKRAVCAQIDTMQAQGGTNTTVGWGADRDYASETVGKYSYSRGTGSATGSSSSDSLRGIPISPLVKSLLFPTGLLYYGIGRCCR